MSCLNVSIEPVASPVLIVAPVDGASVSIEPVAQASITLTPTESVQLTIQPSPQTSISVTPVEGIKLAIGEVCSITGGEMYVLAGTDGQLFTRDGGYILLDPERETD